MTLALRRTGLAPPIYEHLGDYEVREDGETVGRIYEVRAPIRPELSWFWSITVIGAYRAGVATDGRTATFEQAKAQFKTSWLAWKAWRADQAQPREGGTPPVT
jgi:hypothetical protein